MIIAIDGPAGAGKSTIAKGLARRLNYLYIDTGAMYRALAWKILHDEISLTDVATISRVAVDTKIALIGEIDNLRVHLDSRDITSEIRTPQVSQAASIISAIPAVRRALVAQQQALGRVDNVVMEGRDIGTVVFPQADVKIFLDATTDARAERRFLEELHRGGRETIEATRAAIESRDQRDTARADSPLICAEDAVYLDSSGVSIDEVLGKILTIVEAKIKNAK